MADEEREEEDDRPPHDQVDRKADGRDRTPRERLVEDAEKHHRPLHDGNHDALPAPDDREGDGGVAAGNGHVDEDVVEDVEHLLVARLRIHRMVERRGEKHQEDRDDEHRDRNGRQHGLGIVCIDPHGGKRQGCERRTGHHAVRKGVGDLLAQRGDVREFFPAHGQSYGFDVPNL